MRLRLRKQRGFTLLELMIAAAVLIVALTGLLGTYITCLELNELTRNSNLALNAAQAVFEEIRSADFLNLPANYDGYTFQVAGMSANSSLGYVAIDSSNTTLLQVAIGVCWRQKGDRIIGECVDSGGALNFSDANSNDYLDSPVLIRTLMADR